MKVFFICFSSIINHHFYTDLELIVDNIENKNDVTVLHCGGIIDACFFHHIKRMANCYHCKTKFKNNIEDINTYLSSKNLSNVDFKYLSDNIELPSNIKYKFESLDELKSYKFEEVDFGMAVASSLISTIKDHNFNTKKHEKSIKKYLDSSLKIYLILKNIFEKEKPDLVYVFNGRFAETRPIVRLCQKMNINFYTHERGSLPSKYDLFKNTLPHDFEYIQKQIDFYWAKNDPDKIKIAEKWIKDRIKAVDTSWYSFIKEQDENALPSNFDKNKQNISIFNSSEDEFSSIDEKIKMPIYLGQFQAIKNIIEKFQNNKNIHFYLRVHPNLTNLKNTQIKEINILKSLNFDNLTIIESNSKISTYKLISESEKIITFGSTVGIEAVYLNKPSIMIGNALYENLDCIYKPKSEEDLFNLILDKDLEPLNRYEALKYGYWESVRGYDFKYFIPNGFIDGTFMDKNIDLFTNQLLVRKTLALMYKFNFNRETVI